MTAAKNAQKINIFNAEQVKEAASIFAFPVLMLVWAIISYQ